MIYDVGMTIAYEYDLPAVAGGHVLRLLPADIPGVQRRITGLLTIEDVLEEIVGEIDDEHDSAEVGPIQEQEPGRYHVRALARIDEFNDFFDTSLDDENYDTVGGLVMPELVHLPRKGEMLQFGDFSFRVLQADRRRIHSVEVTRGSALPADGDVVAA